MEVNIEQEVANISFGGPHVVLLGAGASRASFPNGEKNGKGLPLMMDYSDIIGISQLLQDWGVDPNQNFEEIFSTLYENGESEKVKRLQDVTESYFKLLEIPDAPTIYDYLILSLRKKDIIATFNWDPLLVQAYLRSRKAGLSLPRLIFLHGNVSIGYCVEHEIVGINGNACPKCRKLFTPTSLLYPIKQKNYINDRFIANEWEKLKTGLKDSFMITIFGYSGPKSDQEAIELMKEAWGKVNSRPLEQTSFITIESEESVHQNWQEFIHSHHYEVHDNFFASWIANHPRRTGEAYWNQYFEIKFIENNPVPQNISLPQLWKWYGQFIEPEQ